MMRRVWLSLFGTQIAMWIPPPPSGRGSSIRSNQNIGPSAARIDEILGGVVAAMFIPEQGQPDGITAAGALAPGMTSTLWTADGSAGRPSFRAAAEI